MIVDPDFLDHWRTGMVADAISDPMAPIYILRLWAHCQERKSDTFVMPAAGIKAQCKCPAPADVFERALIEAGYLERNGDTVVVLGWAKKNASLIAAWDNGAKGGRPKKNPTETHGKPTGSPAVTHGQPIANPSETDKSREDKSTSSLRSEVEQPARKRATPAPKKTTIPPDFGVSERVKAWAVEKGHTRLGEHLEAFKRKCAANAYAYADWDAAFMEAIRGDWAKLQANPHARDYSPQPSGTVRSDAAEQTRKRLEEDAARMAAQRGPTPEQLAVLRATRNAVKASQ